MQYVKLYYRYKTSEDSTTYTATRFFITGLYDITSAQFSTLSNGNILSGSNAGNLTLTERGNIFASLFDLSTVSNDLGPYQARYSGGATAEIMAEYARQYGFYFTDTSTDIPYSYYQDVSNAEDFSSNVLTYGCYNGTSTRRPYLAMMSGSLDYDEGGCIVYPICIHITDEDEYRPIQILIRRNHNREYAVKIQLSSDSAYDATIRGGIYNPQTDPFSPGGTTGDDETYPEGGDGDFENEEVTVDPPALPGLSSITSGFLAVYNPTFAQLQSLGNYLWSDLFSLDTFKKLFNDPMQAILGLSIVPVQPRASEGSVVIGNVNTGITMPRCVDQFVTVDCGTLTIPEYWGGYLDYSPYTKIEIYLPYIGVRPLDTDEVMGRTLRVVYHVDILSGSCVCFIQCDNTIRYHYVGQCSASIPITANDWTRVVNGAVSIATALGVGVATLGAGAAAGGASVASMAGTGALVGGIASQVLASKPRVEHSGSLAGMGGLLGVQFPYIMIVRPRQAVPEGQNSFTGYPSFIRRTLSTVTGYTQVTGVHLVNLSCTDDEKKEIQALLEAGVIL